MTHRIKDEHVREIMEVSGLAEHLVKESLDKHGQIGWESCVPLVSLFSEHRPTDATRDFLDCGFMVIESREEGLHAAVIPADWVFMAHKGHPGISILHGFSTSRGRVMEPTPDVPGGCASFTLSLDTRYRQMHMPDPEKKGFIRVAVRDGQHPADPAVWASDPFPARHGYSPDMQAALRESGIWLDDKFPQWQDCSAYWETPSDINPIVFKRDLGPPGWCTIPGCFRRK